MNINLVVVLSPLIKRGPGRPRGAVVRAKLQTSDDPCVAGTNPTEVGVSPSDETT
jgi:hypothetical protein